MVHQVKIQIPNFSSRHCGGESVYWKDSQGNGFEAREKSKKKRRKSASKRNAKTSSLPSD